MIKGGLRTALVSTGIVLLSIIVGTIIMVLIMLLPNDRMQQNVSDSLRVFTSDNIDNWGAGAGYSQVDNWTDSLMLNIAILRPEESMVDNALLCSFAYDEKDMKESLIKLCDGASGLTIEEYARYWHGYLLYIAPLILFFKVGEIRAFMLILQLFLAVMLLAELNKIDKTYMSLFCVVILFINPMTTALSFQMADIYLIMLISSLVFLRHNSYLKERNRYTYAFLIIGISVAFFDFLTYPTVAYGIPLVMMLLVNDYDVKTAIKKITGCTLAFGSGYAGMWFGKWIVASLFTSKNVLLDGYNSIVKRTNGDVASQMGDNYHTDAWTAIKEVGFRVRNPYCLILCLIALLILILVIKGKHKELSWKNVQSNIPVACIALVPFVWFAVASNHTIIHAWMTYRNLAVSLWALFVFAGKSLLSRNQDDLC